MARITRAQMFMGMARVASMRSTCMRLNVGAIITYDNSIVAVGYNGAAKGEEHCTGNDCPGALYCTRTIHAERNAYNRIPAHLFGRDMDMYATHSPCNACCRMIEWTSIRRVFFEVPYRETHHLDRFKNQLEMLLVTPAGYVVDWFTREVKELP